MRVALLVCGLTIASGVYAGYPLTTEDTGTQGEGGAQLEGVTERETARGTGVRTTNNTLALTYGLARDLDVQGVLPWYQGGAHGTGDPEINLKWRYYEGGPFSAGVKPALTLPVGDPLERAGTGQATWAITAMASYDAAPLAINADIKYLRNRNTIGERSSIRHRSIGLLYQWGPVRLIADYTRETATDPAIDEAARYRVLGLLWAVTRDFGLGLGWKQGGGGATLEESWILGASVRW